MYQEKIINVATGEETWRDYTPEEIAEVKAAQIKLEQRQAIEQEQATAKAALLDRLGITADEARLLLG